MHIKVARIENSEYNVSKLNNVKMLKKIFPLNSHLE